MATATKNEAIKKAMRGQAEAKGKVVPITSKAGTQKAARASTTGAATTSKAKATTTQSGRGRPTSPTSKAERIRQAWLKNPSGRPKDIAHATDTDPAYVWDIRKAMVLKGLIDEGAITMRAPKAKVIKKATAPKATAKVAPKATSKAAPAKVAPKATTNGTRVTTTTKVPKVVTAPIKAPIVRRVPSKAKAANA